VSRILVFATFVLIACLIRNVTLGIFFGLFGLFLWGSGFSRKASEIEGFFDIKKFRENPGKLPINPTKKCKNSEEFVVVSKAHPISRSSVASPQQKALKI
jgi:hypothetical protein